MSCGAIVCSHFHCLKNLKKKEAVGNEKHLTNECCRFLNEEPRYF